MFFHHARTKFLLVVSSLMIFGFTIGFSDLSYSQEKKLTKVRMSVAAFQDTLIPIVGKVKGWYAEEGLDVDIKLLPWYSVQEALAGGSIDVGINNFASVIGAHLNFPDNVYYYGFNTFDSGFAIMIRAKGGLKTVGELEKELGNRPAAIRAAAGQLKGKTIITTSRTDMEQGIVYAARLAGLDFRKDIKIIDLEPDDGLAAFLSGTGDAYLGGIPQRTRAAKEGYLEMLAGTDLGPAEINGLVTTKKYARAHEAELLKIVRVIFRIIRFINSDMEDGGKIIIDELNRNTAANFTMDDFKRFWNNYEHYMATPKEVEEHILNPKSPTYWKARWDDTNHYFAQVIRTIPRPVSPEDAFWMERTHKAYIRKYGTN